MIIHFISFLSYQGIILFILFIFIVDLGHGSWMIVHFMGSLPSGQSPAKPAPAPVPGPGLGRTKDHTQVFAQRNRIKKSGQISRGFCARRNGPGPGSRLAPGTGLGSWPSRLGRYGPKEAEPSGSFILFILFHLLHPSSALFYLFYLFLCAE